MFPEGLEQQDPGPAPRELSQELSKKQTEPH